MDTFEDQKQNIEDEDSQWIAVTETYGDTNTGLVIEYLRSNGLQAVAYENSALALITGANSSARIMVPEEEVEAAMNLLEPADDFDEFEEDGDESEIEPDGSVSEISKMVLGATAVAFDPIGAGIAYAVSRFATPKAEPDGHLVDCPNCGESLELSEEELIKGEYICPECHKLTTFESFVDNLVDCPNCGEPLELSEDDLLAREFVCPECKQDILLDAYPVCPKCGTELETNEEERARGWYICPECHWAVRLGTRTK